MRIVFAGTPHFANTALQALLSANANQGYQVVAVLTQPDRPAGRGMKLTPSPVKQTALAHGVPVYQPQGLKLDGKYGAQALATQAALEALAPDIMVVAAYGLLLPEWTLNLPLAGCLNIHASLLPRWRGAAPLQRAIQAGDTQSGVGLMQMELGLDTGAIYAQATYPITPSTTGGQLHDGLAALGATLLCQYLSDIVAKRLLPQPQSTQGITYAQKLTREHGILNWHDDAITLARQIRAFDPTPGCHFEHAGQTYKVWAAEPYLINNLNNSNNLNNLNNLNNSSNPISQYSQYSQYRVGHILNISAAGVDVVCGSGDVLRITEIQKSGGKRLPVAQCWQHLGIQPTTDSLS